jgi:hypothetical protein
MNFLSHSRPAAAALIVLLTAASVAACFGQPLPPQSAAPAPSLKTTMEGENLLFIPPMNFKVGYHVDRNSMTEWVPNGETVEDWTEILTVQIFRNLKDVTPAAFLQNIGTTYLNACPGTPKDDIRTGNVNGYVVSMLALKCPRNAAGKPETTVFRAINGKDALYLVQHAWRTAPSERCQTSAFWIFHLRYAGPRPSMSATEYAGDLFPINGRIPVTL